MLTNACKCSSDTSFDGAGFQAAADVWDGTWDEACELESLNGFSDGIACCVGKNDGMGKGLASFGPSRPGIADMSGLRSCDLEVNEKSIRLFTQMFTRKGCRMMEVAPSSAMGRIQWLSLMKRVRSRYRRDSAWCSFDQYKITIILHWIGAERFLVFQHSSGVEQFE